MAKLSVLVPIFNEERHLEPVMEALLTSPCPIDREWIVIDDGSSDQSLAILKRLAQRHPLQIFKQTTNQGKGSAIARGVREATGDFVMIQDADFEYDPLDIPTMLQPLLEGKADVVFGSRFKKSGHQVHRTYHYFINRFLTMLSNLLSGIYLTDMETCYKVFRTDLIKSMSLRSRRFGIEVELTAYIAKVRARIHEVPISYRPRNRLQGKKIGWKDGFAALWHLIYFNLMVPKERAYCSLPRKYDPVAVETRYATPIESDRSV